VDEKGMEESGPAGKRPEPELRAVPDEELAEEVVRLEAIDEDHGRPGRLHRSGAGALGADREDGERGPLLEEADLEEFEEEDVEDVWQEGGRRSPMGLVVLAGILGLVLLGVALLLIPRGDRLVEERAALVTAEREAEEQALQDAGLLMEKIEKVVRKYLAAETVDEKLRYVRHRERVQPLMEAYYAEQPMEPRGFRIVTAFYPVGVDNDSFLYMQVRGEDGTLIPLLVEHLGRDEVLVDWETDVAYQPMLLATFLEQRLTEPVAFRVFAKLDTFYAYEFADPERYQCLMLTERDSETYLFGYVERGSEAHRKLMETLGDDPKSREPFLLKLRFLPDSRATRSVVIEEVVAKRWALLTGSTGAE
jgi:hypothetical protein